MNHEPPPRNADDRDGPDVEQHLEEGEDRQPIVDDATSEEASAQAAAVEATEAEPVAGEATGEAVSREEHPPARSHEAGEQPDRYPRFRIGARIEHFILMVSFTALAVTGLPQKYARSPISQTMVDWMGGIEAARLLHRWFAFILVAGSVYHLMTSAYRFFVKRERMRMIPELRDARDLFDWVRYNLGLIDEPPKMPKFNFGEKFEYWAVVWGTAIMTLTGFLLWNPIAATAIMPGEIIPAARAAHGGEALLAVLSIIIWHMYNVHIKHFNRSIFTGYLSREQMEEEHALELERLEAGGKPWPELDLPVLRRRQRVFIVVSVIVGALTLAGLVWLFTFEETALRTVPPPG